MTRGANGHDETDEASGPTAPADSTSNTADDPTLADILDDLVGDYPDVDQHETPDGVEFRVGSERFARVTRPTAHFRLRPEIAAAAVRTGDVSPSDLGRDWVEFAPKRLDQYALDRAQSWFDLGHRLAAEAARGPKRH